MDIEFPRVSKLPPYVFDQIQELKMEARWNGEDVIDFGMGNPDQPTPSPIVEKLRESVLKLFWEIRIFAIPIKRNNNLFIVLNFN